MKSRIGGLLLGVAAAAGIAGLASCSSRINEYPVARRVDLGETRDVQMAALIDEYEKCVVGNDRRQLFFIQQKFRLFSEDNTGDMADTALFYVGRIYYDAGDDYSARFSFRRHKRAFPRSGFRPWIEEIEQEMDERLQAYREWLEATRAGSAVTSNAVPPATSGSSSYSR